jgi:hypothetical protein
MSTERQEIMKLISNHQLAAGSWQTEFIFIACKQVIMLKLIR